MLTRPVKVMPEDAKTEAAKIQKQFYGNPQGLAAHLVKISLSKTDVVYQVFLILDDYSKPDVGCRFLDDCNYFQLLKKNRGFVLCVELYRWLTTIQMPITQPAHCIGNAGKLLLLKSAIDTAKPEKDADEKAAEKNSGSDGGIPFAKLKEGQNIRLSPLVIEKMTKVAADYHTATGKSLTITDGDRTALEQAYMMIRQIRKGEIGLYTNKTAAAEVKKVYDAGRVGGKTDDQIAQDIGRVIQNQMESQGVYISRHLRNGGADIRSRDMSAGDLKAFNQAAKKHGVSVLKEGDHLHLQF